MEKHINAQFQRWEIISKTYTKFISMPKENMSPDYINMKMRLIQQTWSNIEEKHFMLFETYEEEQLNAFEYISEGTFFEWEEEYTKANLAMLESLREFKNKTESSEDNFPGSTNKYKPVEVKIPAIKIPTFNGSYLEWNSFYDQFESLINNNDGLSDVQKLHYLKMHVVGEAANLLRHISVIGNNYAHAWEKLKRRYSNKRIIVNAYLQRLMAIRNCNHESANAIKYLLDTTTDCLNGLNSNGVDTSSWDAIIVYLCVNKLDPESLKQWEDKVNQDNNDDIPTFSMLTNFLEARFRSLEGVQANKTNNVRAKQNVNTYVNNDRKVHHAETSKVIKCTYCDSDHYLNKCQQFTSLAYKDKMKFIESKQLCFNCLMHNHGVKICRIKIRCHTCGKKHNSLIHPPLRSDQRAVGSITREEASIENNIQSTDEDVISHFVKRNTTNVLLATALVNVRTANGTTVLLRALLDQGSEASFITDSAAQALGLKKKRSNVRVSGIGDSTSLQTKHVVTFTIESNVNNNFSMRMEAYVLKNLTKLLPSKRVHDVWPHIQGLILADTTYGTPRKIDLLLGASAYSKVITDGVIRGPPGTPLAQNTTLGWILSGEVTTNIEKIEQPNLINMHSVIEDNKIKIESIESSKTKRKMSEEEIAWKKIYKNEYKRDKEGRYYIVKFPIKDKNTDYGDKFSEAKKRLEQLERQRWSKEYWSRLQERKKRTKLESNIEIAKFKNKSSNRPKYTVCQLKTLDPHIQPIKDIMMSLVGGMFGRIRP